MIFPRVQAEVAPECKYHYHKGVGKRFFLLTVIFSLMFTTCAREADKYADGVSAATGGKGPPAGVLLKRYMPLAAADGMVKIAVLVNLRAGETSRQFIEGCVAEGRSMGFTVDTFVSSAAEARCGEIAGGIARAGYDGLIFAYGGVDFSYDILKPIADNGIPIVTFEALPYRDGQSIKGLVTTFRDDYSLARLSLDTLLSCNLNRADWPTRVARVGCDPGETFLDRRSWVFGEYVNRGTIEEVAFIRLGGMDNPYNAAWEAVTEMLPRFAPGSIDALWVPWNEFAAGCAAALESAGRKDIKLISIDISNEDLHTMLQHSDIWLASAAVDPKLAGTVNMRLLAARLAGEALNDTYLFSPQLVRTADLNMGVNIANIQVMVPHWGDGQGLFDGYQWMLDLKAAEEKYLRIPAAAP